jgi:hypothetical protein
MYKASRAFVAERMRHTTFPVRKVFVRRRPIHPANLCFENANLASNIDVLDSGSSQNPVVAGWIAHRFNAERRTSEFVQHWWNFDPIAKTYFDTTILEKDVEAWGFEYILDDEILHVAKTELHMLEHTVGRDVALVEGQWYEIEISESGAVAERSIDSLSIANLMHFRK